MSEPTKITPEFLAALERLATNCIKENAVVDMGTAKPGMMLLFSLPEQQLAMVARIRKLESLVEEACGELEDTGGPYAHRVAEKIRGEAQP
jgi:hypothetical protein